MEVIIHGAIGGAARLIYPTQQTVPSTIISIIVKDLRRGNHEYSLGQTAYSVEFDSEGYAFTKCLIVRDIQRKAMGYVAFSVYNLNNEKLSGADVKVFLDNLAGEYCSKNIIDYNFDIGKNDCDFINSITTEFERRIGRILPNDVETIHQGTDEAAYVYYSTDEELLRYLDAPFQEEYKPFKQVYFVKSEMEGKTENPLNALRHNPSSNITKKIDLDNPKYHLIYNTPAKNGVNIDVLIDGDNHDGKSKIRKKNKLKIIYTKPGYKEIKKDGKWDEISSEFVIVDNKLHTVTIREVELPPEKIKVNIEVRDSKSKLITGAEVTCTDNYTKKEKQVTNNEINFKAEELINEWTVLGRKGDAWGKYEFKPKDQIGNIVLFLVEHKIVTITATDALSDDIITGIAIQVSTNPNHHPANSKIEFIGNEIEKPCEILISHDEYKSETIQYDPVRGKNPLYVPLQKKQSSGGEQTNPEGHKVIFKKRIIIKVLSNLTPKLIAIIGVGLVILFSILFFRYSDQQSYSRKSDPEQPQPKQPKDIAEEISNYCNGDELFEDTLKYYKVTYCKEHKNWCSQIDNALAIRIAINQGKIGQLKDKSYSLTQQPLELAIVNIENENETKIGQVLNRLTVSAMNLNQIADLITNLQSLLKINISILQSENECNEILKEIDNWKLPDVELVNNIKRKIENKRKLLNNNEEEQPPIRNTPAITTPKQTSNATTSALAASFWNLVRSGDNQKESYDKIIKKFKNKNLNPEENDIHLFLKKICSNSNSFTKFSTIPELTRKNAFLLKDIDK